MPPIFFYGLFMNAALLEEQGLHPRIVGPAVLDGHRIHVGERATLVPDTEGRVFGILMDLAADEAAALYAAPSVRDYVARPVAVTRLDTGEAVDAACYVLPEHAAAAGANPAYAAELARLAAALGFEAAYVDEIAAFG